MLSKYGVIAIVGFCFILSLVVIGLSAGLYFPVFSVVLIPAIILHVYAGIKAFKTHPANMLWMVLSAFVFLGFSLLRLDADQHGPFSGYSALMYHLGASETEHVTPWTFTLEAALLLLLAQIFIDTYILRGFGKIPR